jgi:hypothetical protein
MKILNIRGLLIGLTLSVVIIPTGVFAAPTCQQTPQSDTNPLYVPKDKQRFKPTPVCQLGEKLNEDAKKYSKVPPPGGFPAPVKQSGGSPNP